MWLSLGFGNGVVTGKALKIGSQYGDSRLILSISSVIVIVSFCESQKRIKIVDDDRPILFSLIVT